MSEQHPQVNAADELSVEELEGVAGGTGEAVVTDPINENCGNNCHC